MKKICRGMKRVAAAALICGATLIAGCSYTVMPKNVPLIKGYEEPSLASASVIVTNAEKDSAAYDILTDEKDRSGFQADRQTWSKKIVEALARELARRGAQVRSNAPLTLSIALPGIVFIETRTLYQIKVKVAVSSSAGWSKEYEGRAQSSRYGVLSVTSEADRLAGRALAEAVKAMLGDAEFVGQLTGKT